VGERADARVAASLSARETYELFDAVRNGDAQELRQELGDVLLQVLFTPASPRTHPLTRSISTTSPTPWCASWTTAFGVLAGEQISLEEQLAQWEERESAEKAAKARNSCTDDVPTGRRWRWPRK
jgi:XTP/dITP diphosphohydrolase